MVVGLSLPVPPTNVKLLGDFRVAFFRRYQFFQNRLD